MILLIGSPQRGSVLKTPSKGILCCLAKRAGHVAGPTKLPPTLAASAGADHEGAASVSCSGLSSGQWVAVKELH